MRSHSNRRTILSPVPSGSATRSGAPARGMSRYRGPCTRSHRWGWTAPANSRPRSSFPGFESASLSRRRRRRDARRPCWGSRTSLWLVHPAKAVTGARRTSPAGYPRIRRGRGRNSRADGAPRRKGGQPGWYPSRGRRKQPRMDKNRGAECTRQPPACGATRGAPGPIVTAGNIAGHAGSNAVSAYLLT
jgi:hypothetical protein